MKEEPNDSNGTTLNKDKCQDKVSSSSHVLRSGNKRRLRSVAISDSSEDECTETNMPEQKDKRPKIQCLKMKMKYGKQSPGEQGCYLDN